MRRNRKLISLLSIGALSVVVTAGCSNSSSPIANGLSSRAGLQAQNSPLRRNVSPVVQEAFKPTPESRARVEFAYGQMLEDSKNFEAATPYFETALESNPTSLQYSLALAHNYSTVGRPNATLDIYKAVLKRHRKSAPLHNDLGLHYANQDEFKLAISHLEKAVELQPKNDKYHNNLAVVLAAVGQFDRALEEFTLAIGPAKAHYNVGWILTQKKQYKEAQIHLAIAKEKMPTLVPAEQLLAALPSLMKDTQIAFQNKDEVVIEVAQASGAATIDEPETNQPIENQPIATLMMSHPVTDSAVKGQKVTPLIEFEPIESLSESTKKVRLESRIELDPEAQTITPEVTSDTARTTKERFNKLKDRGSEYHRITTD